MTDTDWEKRLKGFLKKTGDDFKRVGEDIRGEAQKLFNEVQDKERQQKVREGLKDVGEWAQRAANDVAALVNTGVKNAESFFTRATEAVTPKSDKPQPKASRPTAAAKASSPSQAAPTVKARAVKKTVGKKPVAAPKKVAKKSPAKGRAPK